jgi:predicted MFS family arabinose efflux permease
MTSASRPLWLLPFGVTLVAMFTLQLSNLGFAPLLPSIQRDVGMTYTQLGLFTGLYGLLALLLSVPAGISARRFGEKPVLALGLVGVALGSVLLGRAATFESALAFRGLTIFGYRFAFVSVLIAVALTAPPALRGRTMGVLGATSAMASVVGAPLGGALVGPAPRRRLRPSAARFARRPSGCSRSSSGSAASASSRSRISCRAWPPPSTVSMPRPRASSSARDTSPRSC